MVISFGYKHGSPWSHGLEGVRAHDCRRFKNPHRRKELRYLTGLDEAVKRDVLADPYVLALIAQVVAERPTTVAFGCHSGKHRSVVIAEEVARQLHMKTWHMEKEHWR